MTYEYVHPSAFIVPQKYSYANCKSVDFFSYWRNARLDLRFRLSKISDENQALPDLHIEKSISLVDLLLNARQKDQHGFNIIWALIKKFEVFGRLHSHYNDDLRRHIDAYPATISNYLTFAETLIFFADTGENLQYLSTLLKLTDSFCGIESQNFNKVNAQKLILIIDEEAKLVERLV